MNINELNEGRSIAVDASGSAYIAGITNDSKYPTTSGAIQSPLGVMNAFVTKLNSTGTALIYSATIGGIDLNANFNQYCNCFSLTIDENGNAYITGGTNESNFPTTPGAYQTMYDGGYLGRENAFVTKLNTTGTALIYSTYIGGNGGNGDGDQGNSIAIDVSGNAYITGWTTSLNYPTTKGAYQTHFGEGSDYNVFVTKLNPTGNSLVYSTFIGGLDDYDQGQSIAIDAHGKAYITGLATSMYPTTTGAYQTSVNAVFDAFVTELNSTGSSLVYSTFIGGNSNDVGNSIAIDLIGNAYITGQTLSSNYPTTNAAYQSTFGGLDDSFVTKLTLFPETNTNGESDSSSTVDTQWVQTRLTYREDNFCFAVSETNLFTGTNGGGVFLSKDNGANWTAVNIGETNNFVWSLICIPTIIGGTNLFAGTYGSGVYLSTNNGTNWTSVNNGLTNLNVTSFAVLPNSKNGSNLFAGTMDGIFLSTDNGTNWKAVNNGLTDTWVNCFTVSGNNIYAGTTNGNVFFSTNSGTNWTDIGLTNYLISSFAINTNLTGGTNLFTGTWGGVFLSTNNGVSWVNTGLKNNAISSLAISGTSIFAASQGNGIYLSTNNGTNWIIVNSGLSNTDVQSLVVSGTNLVAGTYLGGIWIRPLSEMITGIKYQHNHIPTRFSLSQNYPNPFNPSTTINYQLPVSRFTTLKVYDILGREVAKLVNEEKEAGNYSVEFNANILASGVYFIRMEAGSFVETKKLLLLK